MTDRVPNVWAGIIIPMPFAALALVLRLKARRMTQMGMGIDDVFCVFAWAFTVGYAILVLYCRSRQLELQANHKANSTHARDIGVTHYKLGQRIGHLPQSQMDYYVEKVNLSVWISEFLYSWSIFCTKLAVLTFYQRMFRLLPIRWAIRILMAICIAWILIRTFMTIFRCQPVQYFWDKSVDGHCIISAARYYYATDATHTVLDTLIVTLPIFEVVRTKLPFGQKIAVVGLFACGYLVCIASAFQIVLSVRYDPSSPETPFQMALPLAVAGVEIQLAVVASCLPLLRPILRKFVPGLSSGRSSGASRPSVAAFGTTSFRDGFRNHGEYDTSDNFSLQETNSTPTREVVTHSECPPATAVVRPQPP